MTDRDRDVRERCAEVPEAGARCRLSEHGREQGFMARPGGKAAASARLGRIIGETKKATGWYVVWDGNGNAQKINKDYIEIISCGAKELANV